MRELTTERVEYAENDYLASVFLMEKQERPAFFIICFHVQQSIEKYLKALLVENGLEFERTHDLVRLLELLSPIKPDWQIYKATLNSITQYAAASRYPDEMRLTRNTTKHALEVAQEMRQLVRDELKLL